MSQFNIKCKLTSTAEKVKTIFIEAEQFKVTLALQENEAEYGAPLLDETNKDVSNDIYNANADLYFAIYDTAENFAQNEGLTKADIICSFADFDDTNSTVTVEFGKWCFHIQTVDGVYLPQMGCEILEDVGGYSTSDLYDENPKMYSAMIEAAEAFMSEQEAENIEYSNAGFNCSIANQSAYIKHDKEKGCYTIIITNDDFNRTSYSTPVAVESEAFDTLDEANAYLDQFRTSEHHDVQGLSALISELKQNQY